MKGKIMKTSQFTTVTGMILLATVSTLIPHPPNFSPIGAIALFAGARSTGRWAAFAVPLGALFLRDCVIGLHVLMPVVYACYVLNVCLGFSLKTSRKAWRIGATSLAASCVFFIVTNFADWLLLGGYPPTAQGLFACYVAAIPFFGNTLAGDLFYTALMFGLYALAERRFVASPAHT
jgi:hypothetical protein